MPTKKYSEGKRVSGEERKKERKKVTRERERERKEKKEIGRAHV